MKKETMLKCCLSVVATLLAVAGLAFTWCCPLDCVYGVDSGVFVFKKQLLWNALGIAACAGAAFLPWRKWLKLAPWTMAAAVALAVLSAVLFAPHHGSHRWMNLGFMYVNVYLVLVLAWAFFASYLCSKKCVKPWMVFALVGIVAVIGSFYVFGNANRMARLGVFFGGEDGNALCNFAQDQMKAAYATANWFGDADRSLRLLPNAYADSMPSAAALLFGKWFTLAVAALFAVLGALLTCAWSAIKNPSKRMFVLFWGGAMVLAAVYSFFQSVGFVPVLGLMPPLAAYGGSFTLVFWFGLGVVFSILSDKDDAAELPRRNAIVAGCVWAALFAFFALGVAVVSDFDGRFLSPFPKLGETGEFGIEAKRGQIYAADGSVMARTVKNYNLRFDPVTAQHYKLVFNAESVEKICPLLGLTHGELANYYENQKSRYILIRSNLEEEKARWFLSDEGRRLAKGFIVETLQKREYPLGAAAAHVTGCTHRWNCTTTEGAMGLEYSCNAVLAGKGGEIVRDAGRTEQIARATPVHGGSVMTTVIPSVQNALADALTKAMGASGSETAWGIVMNAKTGEIAAMASLPSYDPGASRDVKDGPDYFVNNAAMVNFEPGGLMKPLTYAMAIDKGLLKPETALDHGDGVWEHLGTRLHDAPGVTGVLSVAEAMIRRTEIGAAKTSFALWKDGKLDNLLKFGFGGKVGGATVYGEEPGIVRPAKKTDPVTFSRLGIGRGMAVTGLQIANAYAALANGGKTVPPHLVAKTIAENGVEKVFAPARPGVQAVSEETAKAVTAMMADAMKAAGNEFGVDFGGVQVAGMIAETPIPEHGSYSKSDYNTFAAGFFPAENPGWVIAVGFSKPRSSRSAGKVALPAFGEVVRAVSGR